MESHSATSSQLYIIDALGPFFVDKPDRKVINWSKVIFRDLEVDGRLPTHTQNKIVANFELYVDKVAGLGYNSVSIDDLAHLTNFSFYNNNLQLLLGDYRALYTRLFDIAKKHNMKIFVNTDYLFFNHDIHEHLAAQQITPQDFYAEALEHVLTEFPQIDGVILRVGEKDGKDVSGSFLSQLMLRTPKQANTLLRTILPLFEKLGKLLIFRTWTVGAYKIGDLIWNESTYDATFASIDSSALIISMKYGDTDFMRHLNLNELFLRGSHKKILELQTRREWEGMGAYPSFVGWDYAEYINTLSTNPTVIGVHAWCQTGGWAKKEWTNLTYLEGSSFWNELNTEVTIRIARYNQSVDEAVATFCARHAIADTGKFVELLRLSEIAIKKGLYIEDLAEKELYFRRSRIPPLMWLTWDTVHLPQTVVQLHRMLLPASNTVLLGGQQAVEAARNMLSIANQLRLAPTIISSLEFELDTLIIFAQLRRYVLRAQTPATLSNINKQIDAYLHKWPQHYEIPALTPIQKRRVPRSMLRSFLRESAVYRRRDKLFLRTSGLQARLVRYYLKKSRSHLADQSMGIEILFK